MTLYQQFKSVIDKHIQPNSRLILGFSGGVDSRVLLDLMAHYKASTTTQCLAIHVHHGLSDNADDWAYQCQQWCNQANIEFRLEQVKLDLEGRSIEESAREARYSALSKHLQQGDLLLTGQHSDDQLETFLLALKRGSGPKGLSAMAESMPLEIGWIVRPLLKVARKDIEAYAKQHMLDWVEDESNQDTRFERNFVRHQVTPILTERWPHIAHSINRSAELCAEQEALLDELMADKLRAVLSLDGSLCIAPMLAQSDLMRARLIRMWLDQQQQRMPSRDLLAKVWLEVALAKQDANPILNLPDAQIRRFNGRLYTVKAAQDVSQWSRAIEFENALLLPDELGKLVLKESKDGGLSLQALEGRALRVIFNPEGLSAHPAERSGSRKLKKLFQEYGIPSWRRRRLPILICEDKVVAIAGLFIDKAFVGQDCELIWSK